MGKFSKALKKADRPDGSEPRQGNLVLKPEAKETPRDHLPTKEVVEDRHVGSTAPKKDASAVERVVATPPSETVHPSSDSAATVITPAVNQHTAHALEQRAEKKASSPPQPAVVIEPAESAVPEPTTDPPNVALVKTPSPAPSTPRSPDTAEPEPQTRRPAEPAPHTASSKKDVRVSYSKTKIQVNDPERLRNNRIISVFDDFETTDQIKILRTQVLKKLKACGGNSLLITSANPYEGKTFTSINLGVSIAKEFDRTVLIIDADIRKPTRRHTSFATEFFSLNVDKGLSDYLLGDVEIPDILINPGINKLTLIPGGTPVTNSPELLNSDRMEQMMREIKSRYASDRIVIVDGPALLPFPDAMILSRYTDGVLAVIEAERTPVEDLKKMMNLLKETNIMGTVLNKNRG